MNAKHSFEMLDASYPMTHHHILDVDLNSTWTCNKTIELVAEEEDFSHYKAQLPSKNRKIQFINAHKLEASCSKTAQSRTDYLFPQYIVTIKIFW